MALRKLRSFLLFGSKKRFGGDQWLRYLSNKDVIYKRNALFSKELERQKKLISRIEKIEIEVEDPSYGCTMVMNKDVSTPYDCARHINEMMINRSVLATVDGALWDLQRPLERNCKLKLNHFKEANPIQSNLAYWRSCSFLLGYVIERAFKEEFYVELMGWPTPNLTSGSFVYDANLKMKDWVPKAEELRTLSGMIRKIVTQNIRFERLVVKEELASKIFEDNKYKTAQIPNIVREKDQMEGDSTVTLYRLGDHIDISSGPMIASTSHVGHFTISSAHQIEVGNDILYRFQGVSTPNVLRLNSFAYNILVERSKKLNCGEWRNSEEQRKDHKDLLEI